MAVVATALALSLGWVGTAAAQLSQLPPNVQEFLQRFEVRQENGRQMVVISLQDLLQLALERNTALDAVKVGESVAMSRLQSARNRFNPTLTTEVTAGRNVGRASSFAGSGNFATLTDSDAMTFSSAYSKPTELGLSYGLTYEEVRSRYQLLTIPDEGDDPTAGTNSDWVDSAALTANVNVPIGQDYGAEINNLPARRSEVGLRQSRLDIRQRELDVLSAVASTYWNIVGALEEVRVAQEAVRLSEQLLEDNRKRLEAGVLSPTDVQVTETQLARDRQQLLSARLAVQRIEDQVRALLALESLPPDIGLRPKDKPTLTRQQFDYERLRDEVYTNNPNLQQLRARLAANALDQEEAQNQDKTNLDLNLFYTFQGYSKAPVKGVTGFAQPQTDSYGAALTWTLPLFDQQTPELIRQRRLERTQIELQMENVRSDLSVRLQSLLRQVRLAEEEVSTARVARRLAEEQLNNELERFRLGQSTSFQVSQVQQEAQVARVQEILALIRFEQNLQDVYVLSGRIYSKYDLQSSVEITEGGTGNN